MGLRHGRRWILFFLTPGVVIYTVLWVMPILGTIGLSLVHWKGFGKITFIDLANFSALARDSMFRVALWHNFEYAIFSLVFTLSIAFGVALLLDRKIKVLAFFRTVIFLPVVLSWVVVSFLWSWLYNPSFGLINVFLQAMHANFLIRNWLGDPQILIFSVIIVAIWKNFPFYTVIFLAGLQGIPKELKEASYIDGASEWQSLWKVVLPLMSPVIGIVITLSLIESFRVFEAFLILGMGGTAARGNPAAEVMSTYMYRVSFSYFRMGYGAALSTVMLVLTMIVSVGYLRTLGRRALET